MTNKITILFTVLLLFICGRAWTESPEIAVTSNQTVNFGTYQANLKKQAVFTLKNRGHAELIIKRIRKTCGCSATVLGKKQLKPGEHTTLTVYIKKNSLEGPYSKVIYVESNSPQQRFLKLTLTGKAVPLLKVFPKKNLYMGTLKVDNSYNYSFKLATTRKDIKLKVKVLKNNFPINSELQKNAEGFILKLKVSPKLKNNFMHAIIELNIISPSGWDPVKIKLRGKSIR